MKMILRKSYISYDIGGYRHRGFKKVKAMRKATDGTLVGKHSGAYYKFSKDSATVFGSVGDGAGLSYLEADEMVSKIVGFRVRGKVFCQVFHVDFTSVRSNVQLALLHNRIAANPPRGLVSSTLDYQVSDRLIVKLSPYEDGFLFTVRVDKDGLVEATCDASACANTQKKEVFRRRCEAIIESINI